MLLMGKSTISMAIFNSYVTFTGGKYFTISAAPLYPGRGCRYFQRRWRFSDKVRASSWEQIVTWLL